MTKRSWLAEEKLDLKLMHDEGLPLEEIAYRLGRTTGSVSNALFRFYSVSKVRLAEDYSKPKKRSSIAVRNCLSCHEDFLSTGPGNRICPFCNKNRDRSDYGLDVALMI